MNPPHEVGGLCTGTRDSPVPAPELVPPRLPAWVGLMRAASRHSRVPAEGRKRRRLTVRPSARAPERPSARAAARRSVWRRGKRQAGAGRIQCGRLRRIALIGARGLNQNAPMRAALLDNAPRCSRNAGVDALRVGTTLLVVLHHTAISYGAIGGWYY